LFQIREGKCRIEKEIDDGTSIILGTIPQEYKSGSKDDIFGEISFLEGGKATASVISDSDDTTILIIEGYYLNILFEYNPDLPGRFYHYVAIMLSMRLNKRQEEERNERKLSMSNSTDKTKKKI